MPDPLRKLNPLISAAVSQVTKKGQKVEDKVKKTMLQSNICTKSCFSLILWLVFRSCAQKYHHITGQHGCTTTQYFSPWKSKCLPWKFLAIFEFPSVKNFFLPWKYPKSCPWNTRCLRENFFQITYVKMGTGVREKYNLLLQWNLAKFTFFCTREKKISSVKIIKFSLFSSRGKKTHPWKNLKKCPWKL